MAARSPRLIRARRHVLYPFALGRTESTPAEAVAPPPIPGLRDPLPDGTAAPAMVWLPGGVFTMGQDDSPWDDERPAHPVRLDAFSIGQYPVTFAEYDRFCAATRRRPPSDQGWGRGGRPVIDVDWEDARAYCRWLGEQTGEHYRLASEAEWEYACRAGTKTRWSCGDDESRLVAHAWYAKNAGGRTHPVGQRAANDWYLHDMHGTVWEWCRDWYASDHYARLAREAAVHAQEQPSAAAAVHSEPARSGAQSAGEDSAPAASAASAPSFGASGVEQDASGVQQAASVNPRGPASGSNRVIRGGSWSNDAVICRSACRDGSGPSSRSPDLGFRLSRTGPWRSYPLTLGVPHIPPESEPESEPPAAVQPQPPEPVPTPDKRPTLLERLRAFFTPGPDGGRR